MRGPREADGNDGSQETVPPPPFFIVGADRSGTTLLRLYLDAHSRLAVPSESWFLIDLLDRFGATGRLDRDGLREAVAMVGAHPRFVDGWRTDLRQLEERLANGAPLPLSQFIDRLYRAETGVAAEAAWGDKTPEYVEQVAALATCFPRARFVNVVRDGRDVYLSLAKRRWSDRGYTPHELGRYWSRCVAAAEQSRGALGARFLEVRYEDLVLETKDVLERLCAFLGVGFEASMLAAHDEAERVITASERAAGVHDKLSRPPRPSDVGRWRAVTGDRSLRLAAAVMANTLRESGYQDAPGPVTAATLSGAAAFDHWWRRRLRPRLRRVARRLRPGPHTAA